MIYPKFIEENNTIGITAPSDGITKKEKIYRLNSAINNLNKQGFKIKETKNVRTSKSGKSTNRNFDIIKNNPKWIQGYSDPTSLLYIITTNLDIATIYGDNIGSFGMKKWHKSLYNNSCIV